MHALISIILAFLLPKAIAIRGNGSVITLGADIQSAMSEAANDLKNDPQFAALEVDVTTALEAAKHVKSRTSLNESFSNARKVLQGIPSSSGKKLVENYLKSVIASRRYLATKLTDEKMAAKLFKSCDALQKEIDLGMKFSFFGFAGGAAIGVIVGIAVLVLLCCGVGIWLCVR